MNISYQNNSEAGAGHTKGAYGFQIRMQRRNAMNLIYILALYLIKPFLYVISVMPSPFLFQCIFRTEDEYMQTSEVTSAMKSQQDIVTSSQPMFPANTHDLYSAAQPGRVM